MQMLEVPKPTYTASDYIKFLYLHIFYILPTFFF
jgi:hypothetical protein